MKEEGRYFIITRSPFTKELQPERYLGRFIREEHAQYRANTKSGDWGECVRLRMETPVEAALHWWKRAIIRSLRILTGVVLGLLTYAFLIADHTGIGDIPFSELTLSMVVGTVFRVGFALGLFWLSWIIAFGPSPQDP